MHSFLSHTYTAAEFAVTTEARVAEMESIFSVCSVMTATPPSATLAREVVLSLTTMDGTGKVCFSSCIHLNV